MTRRLSFDSLGQDLVAAVPELADRYEGLLRDWGNERPGPHVVFGDVLNPYLLHRLTSGEPTAQVSPVLRRIFALLDDMARHDDRLVQEVVALTVLERLGDAPAALAAGRRYMGDATRKMSEDVETFWSTSDAGDATRRAAIVVDTS